MAAILLGSLFGIPFPRLLKKCDMSTRGLGPSSQKDSTSTLVVWTRFFDAPPPYCNQLLSGIRDVGAQGGEEVERRKDARRGGVGAGAALAAVVDDLAGFGAIAHAFQGYRGVSHVASQAPPRLVVLSACN